MPTKNLPFGGGLPRKKGRLYRDYVRGFSPRYWRIRRRRGLITGKLNRSEFRLKNWAHAQQESASYLWQLLLTILSQAVFVAQERATEVSRG